MSIVTDSRYPRVFHYFEEIAAIPHASRHTKAISDYCVAFAREHGLACRQDETNNVVIRKPASAGREEEPAVMIQGHLDMVAAAEEGTDHDFLKEGLKLIRKGDYLSAEGTTLGGDDGIAVAMCLAILEDGSLSHPPLEVVFTVDEEMGMDGAKALDMSDLTAESLINLDCEEEGVLTVSCAGGSRVNLSFPAAARALEGEPCRIQVLGLLGGHSGVEIHKKRVNANHLLMQILAETEAVCPCPVAELAGGAADNAIPSEAAVTLLAGPGQREALDDELRCLKKKWEERLADREPNFTLTWTFGEPAGVPATDAVTALLPLFTELPDGVLAMCRELPDLVETSLNLGILRWEDETLTLSLSVRSSVEASRTELEEELRALAEKYGGTAKVSGAYPAWPLRPDSRLTKLASGIWEEMTGRPMEVVAIHAGLECGIFIAKKPELDIIALGPDMNAIHTPKEELSVSSTERIYAFVIRLLERL